MDLKQANKLMITNPSQNNQSLALERKGVLLDNLSLMNKTENFLIIDFYHLSSDKKDKIDWL